MLATIAAQDFGFSEPPPLQPVAAQPAPVTFGADGQIYSDGPIDSSIGYVDTFPKQAWRRYQMPDGLLYRSYLAGPHEPRISAVIFGDTNENVYTDASVGGRIGIMRYGTFGSRGAEGWQWDFEGGVITRLNLRQSEDVEAADYRFGTLLTHSEGRWSTKFGYFHISSHVGDEFLLRNPNFERINYVTESLVGGRSYQYTDDLRLYGEMVVAFKVSDGAKPLQFQMGAEYTPRASHPMSGAPFAAVNLDLRQSVEYRPGFNLQTGWMWESPESGRRMRLGMQYYNGRSTQFSFFRDKEETLGVGLWFDY